MTIHDPTNPVTPMRIPLSRYARREPVPAVDADAQEDRLEGMAKPSRKTPPNVAVKFGHGTPISKLNADVGGE